MERKFWLQIFFVPLLIAKGAVVITVNKIDTTEPHINKSKKKYVLPQMTDSSGKSYIRSLWLYKKLQNLHAI